LVRVAAGYPSHEALATRLNTDRTTITKIETGDRPPNAVVLRLWLDACGVTGQLRAIIEGLGVLARVRDDPSRVAVAPWFEQEAKAHTLRYWAPTIVPGMFQTRAYAGALFTGMGYDQDRVSELVEERVWRQGTLAESDPPDVMVVLWEPVLYHMIGTPEVMREQVARLVELTRWVSIQVLPGRLGANPGLGGAINLAATDDAPELLVSDSLAEDRLTNDPVLVRRASATFNGIRGDALPRAESRNTLVEAMERWRSDQTPHGGNPVTADRRVQ
jgi:hypothetical protein